MSLRLRQVHIAVGGRELVRGLDAEVERGQVLALMGPSGSGKSSLLAWIAGTLEAPFEAQGQLLLDGVDIGSEPVQRRRIGLLFQDDLLFPHLNVLGNLLFALPAGRRAERVARAEAALAQAELAGFGPRWPHSLSGGQRARVSLLRALLAEPKALLLDEPFAQLDTTLREQVRRYTFATLAERGVPTVLVTHDAADVPPGATCLQLGAP